MLKKIWNDPVWSNVIATVIAAAILAGITLVFSKLTSAGSVITIIAGITASLAIVFASLILMKFVQKLRQPIQWDFSGYFLGMTAAEGKTFTFLHFKHEGAIEPNVTFDASVAIFNLISMGNVFRYYWIRCRQSRLTEYHLPALSGSGPSFEMSLVRAKV